MCVIAGRTCVIRVPEQFRDDVGTNKSYTNLHLLYLLTNMRGATGRGAGGSPQRGTFTHSVIIILFAQ